MSIPSSLNPNVTKLLQFYFNFVVELLYIEIFGLGYYLRPSFEGELTALSKLTQFGTNKHSSLSHKAQITIKNVL